MKKKVVIIVTLMLIAFFSLKYWTVDFDESYACSSFAYGDEEYEEVSVRLVGKLNKSLLLENYISYVIYIDGERYPKENHLLMPFRNFGHNEIRGHGKQYRKNFEPVNVIEGTYSSFEHFDEVNIAYTYWLNELSASKPGRLHYGSLAYSKDFEDIVIMIPKHDENRRTWSNTLGYEVIVSGYDLERAKLTLEKLNLELQE